MKFISNGSGDTYALGKMLGRALEGGEIILAYGDLGAGKTALAKGIAEGIGVKQIVNSPTFNIMKVYSGKKLNFYHIDAYRLEDPEAVNDIGFDEAIGNPDGVSFIEWPDFIKPYWEKEKKIITVRITILGLRKRLYEIEER